MSPRTDMSNACADRASLDGVERVRPDEPDDGFPFPWRDVILVGAFAGALMALALKFGG